MITMRKFNEVFKSTRCAVIGMLHVGALPGTPLGKLSYPQIIDAVCREAEIYAESGVVCSAYASNCVKLCYGISSLDGMLHFFCRMVF